MGAAQAGHLVAEGARVIVADIQHDAAKGVASRLGAAAVSIQLDRRDSHDLPRAGIRGNTVCPGAIATPMLRAGTTGPDALEPVARQVPLRALGDPIEVAKAVAFLVSDDSAYITGTDLVVDGGVMAKMPLNM